MEASVLTVGDPVYPEGAEPMDQEKEREYQEKRARELAEARAAEGVPEGKPISVEPVQEALFSWAGKQPGTVKIKLKFPPLEVDEGVRKGTRFSFEGEALVVSEGAKDLLDKETGLVVESEQSHDAVVLSLQIL